MHNSSSLKEDELILLLSRGIIIFNTLNTVGGVWQKPSSDGILAGVVEPVSDHQRVMKKKICNKNEKYSQA